MKIKHYIITAIICVLFSTAGNAQITNYRAYALYTYNFIKHTQFPNSDSPTLDILVLGNSKTYDELSALLKEANSLHGKTMTVRRINSINEISDCYLVYISDNKSSLVDEVKNRLSRQPTLIVSEREGLFKRGSDLSFTTLDNGKLRFEINPDNLGTKQLQMSSSLTRMAINMGD